VALWFRPDPNDRYALPILVRDLGLLGALRVGLRVKRRLGRGEPFEALGPPADANERLSREQIAGAVVLYRELLSVRPPAEALSLTEEVVIAAGVAFLRQMLGTLDRDELERLDEGARAEFARDRAARFFNATMRWDEIGGDRVSFTVTSCHFPRLCAEVGASQLAPMFCRVDAHFFGSVAADVTLIRPQTLATGGTSCPFTLQWAPRP
jgi:hypothetical protein